MVEGLCVISLSLLPRCATAPNIGFNHPLTIGLALDHCGLVDDILGQAVTLQGAGACHPGGLRAVAGPLLLLGQAGGPDLFVVLGQDLVHVWAGPVAQLKY